MAKAKPVINFKIPKNVFSGVLTPDQCHVLQENGWEEDYRYVCNKCHARGCEHCHGMGIMLTLTNSKNRKHMVTAAPYFDIDVGAMLRGYWSRRELLLRFSLDAQMGSAHFALTMNQMWRLAQIIVNLTADPQMDVRMTDMEFAVPGNLFGPPAMYAAGLKTKGQAAMSLTKHQKKAVALLRKAGLEAEADFFEQACKHECFLVHGKRQAQVREQFKKVKPGTILERKGNTAVIVDGARRAFAFEINASDQSVVGTLR